MDAGKEAGSDFYSVLGLKKDCSATELRSAYKKLALRWHPDRCCNSSSGKHVEESKKKFQAVQEAYSVLSDANKRFLYDVGIYDSDEEDDDGMCDFLDEMAEMMGQTSSSTDGCNSFESLQDLFVEMFPGNMYGSGSTSVSRTTSLSSETDIPKPGIKRNSCEMNFGEVSTKGFCDFSSFESNTLNDHVFCVGVGSMNAESSRKGSRHKNVRKPNGYAGNL
ncbi:unnamed protein product [Victoria cruziana]